MEAEIQNTAPPRHAALLGNPDTKRTAYFKQAAAQALLPVLFVDWKDFEKWRGQLQKGEWFLKIDPPLWTSCSLDELNSLARDYKNRLSELSHSAQAHSVKFLNHPSAIMQLLDKRSCKAQLKKAGIAVTKELETDAQLHREEYPAEMLLEIMHKQRIHQVFIKPVNGSGAAGVSAFRLQPSSGRMSLYTCALDHPDFGLVNTKCLRHFSDPKEIIPLLDKLLKLDCVAERWYAKSEYQGYSYDLRAVLQDGRLDFLLARLSKGPITNLHLNNHPSEISRLGIPAPVLDAATHLCQKAADCFPGLRSAGIDILLEKGSWKPRIIEMNAQGDLIYQDIFHNNIIYKNQAGIMQMWMNNKVKQ